MFMQEETGFGKQLNPQSCPFSLPIHQLMTL